MKLNILLLSSVVLLASSCNDWLDVQPTTEKDREDLVTSADGYKQMLYGTYINLVSTDLYGHNMSYGILEGVARNYCKNPVPNYNYLDTSVRPVVDAIWEKMYNNIANVNSILKDVEKNKSEFAKGEEELLEGEALAQRAYMHFDLMRLFAPAYKGNEDKIAIPYVESYERVRYPHIAEKLVIGKVLRDLDRADSLLSAGGDPLINGAQTVTYSGKGIFTANRQYRFNYWAVQALRARVYMYIGDTANALKYATLTIEKGPFSWVTEADVPAGDRIFLPEMICGLDVPELPNYYESYFTSESYSLSDGWGTYGLNVFEDANDYRFLYLLTNDKANNKVISCKYKQTIGSGKVMKKQTVPLIRLGEMYLIAAECNMEKNPAMSISLLRTLKLHRGYLSENQGIADGLTTSQIRDYITKEMRKETYAEGQMWFYYKRLDSPTTPDFSPWWAGATTTMKTSYYTFPLPESEKEYGNIPSSN